MTSQPVAVENSGRSKLWHKRSYPRVAAREYEVIEVGIIKNSDVNRCATGGECRSEPMAQCCGKCNGKSRPVSQKTVLLMLKPELLERALTGTYRFCATHECPVVYFDEDDQRAFTQDDLRVIVGVKANVDPIPLCYCFGFDESHIRDEISQTGKTTIPERISNLIREGLCACEARNPAGVCCLGELRSAIDRLTDNNRLSENERANS